MSDCSSCPSNGSCSKSASQCGIQNNPLNKIKNVIGVMSGKGGVGKSTISVMLAKQLKSKGLKVGVMDADITGPSVCRLLNLAKGTRAYGDGNSIFPVESPDGIKVISLNLMLEDENQPVIWRGSLLSSCVTQFWNEVLWGELDYLIIDMPPGTGDVTLTIMQSIPLNGVVMVSVPQDMVSMIVSKSINMAKAMNIKILGIIENMSYTLCPHCGEKIKLYANDPVESFIKDNQTTLLGELPSTASLCAISDDGTDKIEESIKAEFENITNKITQSINN